MTHKTTVLIADDHPLARDSLRSMVSRALPDAIVIEAATADEVRQILQAAPELSLLMLDLVMPGTTRFELLEETCETYPDLKILVLSASESPYHKRKSLDLGASGYVTKSLSRSEIENAIRIVISGGVYVPPELLPADSMDPTANSSSATERLSDVSLTPRQMDVLNLAAQGKPNKAIARDLDLTENTVKIHMAAILKAFGAKNRTEAVMAARRLGLLED